MGNAKNVKNLVEPESAVMAFLSGKGPSPFPNSKQSEPGPLGMEFLEDVEADIKRQDQENEERPTRSWEDDVLAIMRLRTDNREMIRLLKSGSCSSISALAETLGRELSNVSRTLSKLAAYGMVGYERDEKTRVKKPIWLLPIPEVGTEMEWIEAFCVLKAMRIRAGSASDPQRFKKLEAAVMGAVRAASIALESVDEPASSSKRVKAAPA